MKIADPESGRNRLCRAIQPVPFPCRSCTVNSAPTAWQKFARIVGAVEILLQPERLLERRAGLILLALLDKLTEMIWYTDSSGPLELSRNAGMASLEPLLVVDPAERVDVFRSVRLDSNGRWAICSATSDSWRHRRKARDCWQRPRHSIEGPEFSRTAALFILSPRVCRIIALPERRYSSILP